MTTNALTNIPWLRTRVIITGLLVSLVAGCGYGEVSPQGYDYATALYSICNRKDAARLDEWVSLLDADVEQGKLAEQEARWFRDIAAQARAGDWQSANAAARQLLEDQVRER